jgi:hypothetical protein
VKLDLRTTVALRSGGRGRQALVITAARERSALDEPSNLGLRSAKTEAMPFSDTVLNRFTGRDPCTVATVQGKQATRPALTGMACTRPRQAPVILLDKACKSLSGGTKEQALPQTANLTLTA